MISFVIVHYINGLYVDYHLTPVLRQVGRSYGQRH